MLCFATITITMLSPSSLRAEIIYNVGLSSKSVFQLRTNSNYAGNSFLTGSAPSTLNSISLYLSRAQYIGKYPTGALSLDIYIAKESSTAGLYVPNLSTPKLATASIDVSILAIVSTPSTLTRFNYTGVNAITLSANTNYAFNLNTSQLTIPTSSSINYLINNGQPADRYPNGNFFGNVSTTGSSAADMSGQIDVTAVPEPGTMILFGVTMAVGGAVAVIRERRKRNTD